jgi:hypothetical protein
MERYMSYLKLTPKERKKRIDEAQQSEKYRSQNPQANYEFDEYGWIDFTVDEDGKRIKL